MGDGQLGHVVALVAEGDEVVVYPGLVLVGVIKVELFRLDVVWRELFHLELCDLFKEALFLCRGHAPYYHDAVVKKEDLRGVYVNVKVDCVVD